MTCFSSSWEREREWYTKFGYKGEMSPKLLIFFFRRGFHWRIFLLSRANRLYSIFFSLAWRTWGPSCLSYSFVFNPEYWLWFVCPLRTLLQKLIFLTIYFRWRGGSPTSVLGSQPIIWLLSPSPSGVRQPEVTKYQHLLMWPTFSLSGHFFDGFPLFIPTGG